MVLAGHFTYMYNPASAMIYLEIDSISIEDPKILVKYKKIKYIISGEEIHKDSQYYIFLSFY